MNKVINANKSRYITLSAILVLLLLVCYYLLQFLSFHFLATSDKRGNLDCVENLRKIYVALSLYQERYGSQPDNLSRLVDCNFIPQKNLKCPLKNRVKFFGLIFSFNSKNECDYFYTHESVVKDSAFYLENNKLICRDRGFYHNNAKTKYFNVLYQDGTIIQIMQNE